MPASLVAKWEVDVQRSKVTPIRPNGQPLSANALRGLITLDVTTNAFSIITRYEMVIRGQTNIQCVAAASSPSQATFRKTYQNGKSVEYRIEARGTNSIQLVSVPARLDFLTAYIWKKENVQPSSRPVPK